MTTNSSLLIDTVQGINYDFKSSSNLVTVLLQVAVKTKFITVSILFITEKGGSFRPKKATLKSVTVY